MPWRRRNAVSVRTATTSRTGSVSIVPARCSAPYIGSAIQLGKPACATRLLSVVTERVSTALPTATTMTAEYTPARRRTMMVTATIVCVPLGGMLAGLFAHEVLPRYGWRGLSFAGGALPLVLGFVLVRALPESPRYLARRPARWPELGALLARMERPVAPGTAFTDLKDARAAGGRGGFGALLAVRRHIPRLSRAAAQPREGEELARTSS